MFGFAKQSGGEVRVESEVGTGTQFTLYLPSVPAPETLPVAVAEPVFDGQGAAILVVEADEDVGAFTTQALAELGYETVWAKDAEQALERLGDDGGGFDVVFSDVVMPGMDGIDLAREIGCRPPGLQVILASGYSHVLAGTGTSGFQLIRKPYSIEELSRVLRKAAGRHRRARRRPWRACNGGDAPQLMFGNGGTICPADAAPRRRASWFPRAEVLFPWPP